MTDLADQKEFEERADYSDPEDLEKWNVDNEYFLTIQNKLVQKGAKLIVGPKGTGKTHQIFDDIFAEAGDILIARVGKRCIGKVAMVSSGRQVISDCVYLLRAPKGYGNLIFKELCSDNGRQWFQAVAHGVCSRVISKKNLLNFQVDISINAQL